MTVHDMDILERLRRSVTKGHEPTDADALAAIAEIARLQIANKRLQIANKQSMAQADMRSAENCKLRQENERLRAMLIVFVSSWQTDTKPSESVENEAVELCGGMAAIRDHEQEREK